jgi:hypothetical protein
MPPAEVRPTVVAAARPSPRAEVHHPTGHRGTGRASRYPLGSRVAANRGCRVRGSRRAPDRPVRGSRRAPDRPVRGSRRAPDRPARESLQVDRPARGSRPDRPARGSRRVADHLDRLVRGSRPVVDLRARAAAEVRPDHRDHIEPLEPGCKGPRGRHLTVVRGWPRQERSRARPQRPVVGVS